MTDSDREVPGVDVPILETDFGHHVAWTGIAIAWFVVAAGFFALDRPLFGVANVALGVGGLWRASNPA